jgi:TRAP-type C4-dicarboxylate transport system substrate-binding protein
VASLEDLAGKRVRVVSHEATEMVRGFGGEPVRLPSSKIYLSLQRGALDAVVANVSTVVGRQLHEQLRFCYRLPVTAYSIAVFLRSGLWNALPEEDRRAFLAAGRWYDAEDTSTINGEIYPRELWPAVQKAGIEVVDPTPEETGHFTRSARPIWDWWLGRVGRGVGTRALELARGLA